MPHSEIHGSKLIRSSPQLIAAYHVLLRLCMPRHPPNALTTLNRSHCLCSSSSRRFIRNERQTGLPFTTQPTQQSHRRVRQACWIGVTPSDPLANLSLRPASRDLIQDRAVRQRSSDVPSETFRSRFVRTFRSALHGGAKRLATTLRSTKSLGQQYNI